MKRKANILSNDNREWWKSNQIYVFGTKGINPGDIKATTKIVKNITEKLNLPLHVLNGNENKNNDIPIVNNLINNTQKKLIDCEDIEKKLKELWKEDLLPYGLVVLVNPEEYKFKPLEYEDSAIYGYGTLTGLILLRKFDIKNAVLHEFGHMIGLGNHHPNCVMDYSCSIDTFCENCLQDIEWNWDINTDNV